MDGYNTATNTCYELAGCFFHGCVKCYAQSNLNPVAKVPYGELYLRFSEKTASLKSRHGQQVVMMWECEWCKLSKTNPTVRTFLQGYKKSELLDPRQALYGGRTNAMKLYHKVEGDEKVRYYDFTSLYPAVNAKKQYPVGHPQIIYRNFDLTLVL